MTYNNQFVAVVKVNGKILREINDVVTLPFGTEYSIMLKNLSPNDCVATIEIDGQNVMGTDRLVVRKNSTSELDGFTKGGQYQNRFKFIEKTKEISDFRGDRIDDSLIRIEYQFEKPITWLPYVISSTIYHNSNSGNYYGSSLNEYQTPDMKGFTTCNSRGFSSGVSSNQVVSEGITVKGSELHGNLDYVHMNELENIKHVIVFKLQGFNDTGTVYRPIAVKTKLVCSTCGKTNHSNNKFCYECGTFLERN